MRGDRRGGGKKSEGGVCLPAICEDTSTESEHIRSGCRSFGADRLGWLSCGSLVSTRKNLDCFLVDYIIGQNN